MQQHPAVDPALEQAYRAAEYCIEDAGVCLTLRIGQGNPALRDLLPHGAGAAFLTASNPLGRNRDPRRNAEANAMLEAEARALGARVLRGTGRAPDRSWEEHSLLLVGVAPAQAMELARRHRQLAWVWVPRGEDAPVLVWTGLQPDRDGG